jgi:hypothetical protein
LAHPQFTFYIVCCCGWDSRAPFVRVMPLRLAPSILPNEGGLIITPHPQS